MNFEACCEIIELCSTIGKFHLKKQSYQEAITNFKEGLTLLNKYFCSAEDVDGNKQLIELLLLDLSGNINKATIEYSNNLSKEKEHDKAIVLTKDLVKFYEFELSPDLYNVVKPKMHFLYHNIGFCLKGMDCYQEAIIFFKKVLNVDSRFSDLYRIIGDILAYNLEQKAEAIYYYEKFIELDSPNNSLVYNTLGFLYESTQKWETVPQQIHYFEKAVELDPDFHTAHKNLAVVYSKIKDWENARRHFEEMKRLKFTDDNSYDFGAFNVNLKNFDEGWQYMETRFTKKLLCVPYKNPGKPEWEGEICKNDSLLVDHEQGFGDTLQFIRYVPLLSKYVSKVILRVQHLLLDLIKPAMEHLCAETGLKIEVISSNVDLETVEFDYYIPLMSLLNVLKVTDKDVPYVSGYLKADAEKVKYFKEKYFMNDKLKIGFNWKTFKNMSQRVAKCVEFEQFNIFGNLDPDKVTFYSIQYEAEEEELAKSKLDIIDLTNEINDFNDTAAIIQNLDILISIDSAPAHLAGALGKPVWLLLIYNSCWRWFEIDTTSVWYDKAVLFRQDKDRDWNTVINSAYESIKAIVSNN